MSKEKLFRVVFEPDGREVRVPAGTLVSKAAAVVGRAIEMPCGGMGTCGKCKIVVSGKVSEPDASETRLLSSEELANGVRLGCRTKVEGDVHISIPESSKSSVQKILSHGLLRDCGLSPGVSKIYCELPKPSLEDERAEFERLSDCLRAQEVDLSPNYNVIRGISQALRSADYCVTAVTFENELIAVEAGDTTKNSYGIAYDLGSTTVVGYLMDLNTGKELAVSSVMNPQMVYGDDLVSRISFATTQKDGAKILQSAAVEALNRVAVSLAESAGISLQNVYKITLVGNTCMSHLVLGIDVHSLGQSPYVPSISHEIVIPARELGLNVCPEAKLIVLPNVAGFVGSDLVGVLLSNLWESDSSIRLAVDIGTNGEMALLNKGKMYVCSAAAGPAFEGAGISCGMRGAPGAIDSVNIDEDVCYSTIDNKKPVGICGSGLVDAVAQMLDAGVIDENGRLLPADEVESVSDAVRSRIVEGENGLEFVLATREEAGCDNPIVLTGQDIRRLQLVKGSIHAAIQTLLKVAGTSDDELDEIMLAGAFGNYIRVESAIRIGLIPPVSSTKVTSIGNAAGAGARLALLCQKETELARKLAGYAQHIELAVSPDYQMELMECMLFPAEFALM